MGLNGFWRAGKLQLPARCRGGVLREVAEEPRPTPASILHPNDEGGRPLLLALRFQDATHQVSAPGCISPPLKFQDYCPVTIFMCRCQRPGRIILNLQHV
jgi:hypothetical protein